MSPDRPSLPRFPLLRDTGPLSARAEEGFAVSEPPQAARASGSWALQSAADAHGTTQRVPIHPLPFRIGRASDLPLALSSTHVSKQHAEIYSDGFTLRVRDLDSRNGTCLNQQPVTDAPLYEGDVLQIGDAEFRVVQATGNGEPAYAAGDTVPLHAKLAPGRVRTLIDMCAVSVDYQPIVAVPSREPAAYEALGRGCLEEMPRGPVELFDLAGILGLETQARLSRLFRRKAVELVRGCPRPPLLFLNTHPAEFTPACYDGLIESLKGLRGFCPEVSLALEIHESALRQIDFLRRLADDLSGIGVGLAYDDFGAGEARLFELAEVPPDYLKFDRRFVTGIHAAPLSRQRLVSSLVAAARELHVKTVAEGVETPEEAEACRRAGFSHGQGYYFGRPIAAEELLALRAQAADPR